jgi:tetratricopeptide (TPR) repeat protein
LARAQAQPAGDLQSRLEKANSLYLAGSDKEAKAIYESLLPQLRGHGPSRELVEALRNLYGIVGSAGDYDRALALANEAAVTCHSLHDAACEANARNDAGFAYSNAGDYARAAVELDLALKLNGESDSKIAVLILNNLGNVYYYQAKYTEALRTYESALSYLKKSAGQPWVEQWTFITRVNLATL